MKNLATIIGVAITGMAIGTGIYLIQSKQAEQTSGCSGCQG